MFFGLTNSPATFQTMMNEIFFNEISEGWFLVYMDDLLIMAHSEQENLERTYQILDICRQHHLFFKPEKCTFAQTQVDYLGVVISQGKVEMDKSKTEAIRTWPIPRNTTDL
jgi:hypothetical protein